MLALQDPSLRSIEESITRRLNARSQGAAGGVMLLVDGLDALLAATPATALELLETVMNWRQVRVHTTCRCKALMIVACIRYGIRGIRRPSSTALAFHAAGTKPCSLCCWIGTADLFRHELEASQYWDRKRC